MSKGIDAIGNLGELAYKNLVPDAKRSVAVAAALELILGRTSSMSAHGQLAGELGNLSTYADQIQAALDKK